jgi:hypothetical protein
LELKREEVAADPAAESGAESKRLEAAETRTEIDEREEAGEKDPGIDWAAEGEGGYEKFEWSGSVDGTRGVRV